jgi:hypothetical protein
VTVRRLTARDVLEVWEEGERQHPIDRALTLLATAWPERSRDELAALPLGECNGALLALRERLFGPRIVGIQPCAACGEELEIPLSTTDLRRELEAGPAAGPGAFTAGGVELRFRPLDSRDLAAAVTAPDARRARRLLAERSVLSAHRGTVPVACEELSEEIVEALAERLAESDPGAEIRLEGRCPGCDRASSIELDPGELLWTEVRALARRLLSEVALLASSFHFGETEILAMSPARRRAYLEMLGG